MITNTAEIFRHLCPQVFNSRAMELENARMGGVSFLMRPIASGVYNFWVYVCPEDAQFSARQAVKSLRDRADSGTVEYGVVTLNGDPLIDQLIAATQASHALPSKIPDQISRILSTNAVEAEKLRIERLAFSGSVYEYQER